MTPSSLISAEYAALNRQLHAERPDYGTGSAGDAEGVVNLCRANGLKVVLDFGCGKGALRPSIAAIAPDLIVLEFDPAVPGKDEMPADIPDLVVALDVMEHIEPLYLERVLQTLQGLRPKLVLLVIATEAARKYLPDGRNAHLIVEGAEWWKSILAPHFIERLGRATASHFTFIGEPRP